MTNKYMYFIANWKMFGGLNTLNSLHKVVNFLKKFKKNKYTKIIYCPPNTLIRPMSKKLKNSKIVVGAQNCHQNQKYGAFTGSVNSKMLKDVGAKYVIIGHSENRQSGENDKLINVKIKCALKFNLKVIFCIGETLKEKNKGKTFYVLKKQIKDSLKKNYNINKILIAYEPVWSIGTNKLLKANDLQKIIIFIKNELKKIFKTKMNPRVLYGGSVNQNNIKIFSPLDEIDGFLIGGASQSPKKFIDIIKNYYK